MLNHTELKNQKGPLFVKSILIIDDNPDITLTFKKGLEAQNNRKSENNNIFFDVFAYNDPILALSEFKSDFYDLMLVDINMPKMNGFDFCVKALEIDVNPKVCFMSSGLINQEELRDQYPSLSIGCFIKKPITIKNLIERVKAELEYSPSNLLFDDILKLVEYIPITGTLPSNGRFARNVTMDSIFYFENLQRNGSFRDIVRSINLELTKIVRQQQSILQREKHKASFLDIEQRYKQLHEIGCSYPIEYLLFDFCLAVLDEDFLDAGLYLAHSFHILGLSKSFNLLLSVIVNEKLVRDRDVRRLIILLARAIEPRNAESYADTYGIKFRRRYELYRKGFGKEGI
jgi:DNA-binding response OmpR family regulator